VDLNAVIKDTVVWRNCSFWAICWLGNCNWRGMDVL